MAAFALQSETLLGNTKGILGVFDNNPDNDITDAYGEEFYQPPPGSEIITRFADSCKNSS